MNSQYRRGRVSSTSAAASPRRKKKALLAVLPWRMESTPSSLMRTSRWSTSPSRITSPWGSSERWTVTSPLTTCTSTPFTSWEGRVVPVTRRLAARPELEPQKKPRSLS